MSSDGVTEAIVPWLKHRHSERVRHGARSLSQHLLGTSNVLRAWGQSDELRLGGLLHSVYATDRFRTAIASLEERDELRALAGRRAEELAFWFCSISRDELLHFRDGTQLPPAPRTFVSWRDGQTLTLSEQDVRDLIVIHMANEAEQSAAADGSPAPWLARVSALGRRIARLPVPPPVLDRCRAVVSTTGEQELLDAYRRLLGLDASDVRRARHLARVFERAPWVGEPFVCLGILTRLAGDVEASARLARQGRALLSAWGTPWDKRYAFERWLTVADDLEQGSEPRRAAGNARPTVGALLHAEMSAGRDRLPPRFAQYVSRLALRPQERLLYPGLSNEPWHAASEIPLARELEERAPQIIDEFHRARSDGFHPESERIRRDGSWDVLILFERGRRRDETCAQFPLTTELIGRHQTVRTSSGLAYFSRLGPHSRVAEHRGPVNTRLRCHFGIVIPEGCGLTVAGHSERWQQGKCLVFDDSFPHAVWNDSDAERIVLIIDVWHPDLTQREIELLAGLDRYVERKATELGHYWAFNAAAGSGAKN